jgi:hypothetical protein
MVARSPVSRSEGHLCLCRGGAGESPMWLLDLSTPHRPLTALGEGPEGVRKASTSSQVADCSLDF